MSHGAIVLMKLGRRFREGVTTDLFLLLLLPEMQMGTYSTVPGKGEVRKENSWGVHINIFHFVNDSLTEAIQLLIRSVQITWIAITVITITWIAFFPSHRSCCSVCCGPYKNILGSVGWSGTCPPLLSYCCCCIYHGNYSQHLGVLCIVCCLQNYLHAANHNSNVSIFECKLLLRWQLLGKLACCLCKHGLICQESGSLLQGFVFWFRLETEAWRCVFGWQPAQAQKSHDTNVTISKY